MTPASPMDSERWERIQDLVSRARELGQHQREAFLDEACGADRALRAQLAGLLGGDDPARGFLATAGADEVAYALQDLSIDHTGAQLGDFHVDREIGRGATGIVYQATQLSVKRKVALKVLAPLMVSNAERLERFRREAYSQSRLRHPHVVAAFYFGTHNGIPYLAMELVQGKSLREHMTAGRQQRAAGVGGPAPRFDPFDSHAAAGLIAKVASALDYCHRQGVIHRDIKPNNILIDEQLDPRIIDFGLARDQSLEALTRTGDISGTPYYMSPEQARARQVSISHRTDIYSAGAVLYEMLTHEPPFPGTDSLAVLQSICNDRLRPVRSVNPAVPVALERICHKAMEKDPELRYQTAAELADDLRSFLAGRPVKARSPSVARRIKEEALAHPRLAALLMVLVIGSTFAALQMRLESVNAEGERAVQAVERSKLLKSGIPETAFDRKSPAERTKTRRDYRDFLIDQLPDTVPAEAAEPVPPVPPK